jgi:ribosomal protein S18 acetylase RimI-like enzyme
LPTVVELFSDSWRTFGARTVAHPGDLYWMLRPRQHFEPTRDIQLWGDSSGLIAATWFDGPASAETLCLPGRADELQSTMISWLEDTHMATEWGERFPAFSVRAWDDDGPAVAALERLGYRRSDAAVVRFEATPGLAGEAVLPGGFRFEPVTGESQSLEKRTALQRAAFEGATTDAATWRTLQTFDGYNGSLDIFLVDEDGIGAAAALCWYDEPTRSGEFEPVGTAPRYQGHGLGRAVMAEGLRRLALAGATTAIVTAESDNPPAVALYRSAGFEVVGTRASWERDLR